MPMKKFKQFSWIVCGFLLLFLGATFVFHRFSLRNESKLLTPIGKQVTVNGHRMNVSVKGEGPQTIVFLSGAGIASPILDFKNLSDPLSKKYRYNIIIKHIHIIAYLKKLGNRIYQPKPYPLFKICLLSITD